MFLKLAYIRGSWEVPGKVVITFESINVFKVIKSLIVDYFVQQFFINHTFMIEFNVKILVYMCSDLDIHLNMY